MFACPEPTPFLSSGCSILSLYGRRTEIDDYIGMMPEIAEESACFAHYGSRTARAPTFKNTTA